MTGQKQDQAECGTRSWSQDWNVFAGQEDRVQNRLRDRTRNIKRMNREGTGIGKYQEKASETDQSQNIIHKQAGDRTRDITNSIQQQAKVETRNSEQKQALQGTKRYQENRARQNSVMMLGQEKSQRSLPGEQSGQTKG